MKRFQLAAVVALGALVMGGAASSSATPAAKTSAPKKQRGKKPMISIRDVQRVYYRRALGDSFFSAQLRAQLKAQGLRFVAKAADADAILDSKGQSRGQSFHGEMTFFDANGAVIWSGSFVRPARSQVMAFSGLAQQLRAARRGAKQRR